MLATACLTGCGHAASAPVSVFPIPGGHLAAPQTQITFRGEPKGSLGTIAVTGSHSGRHSGRLVADSDGRGASFLPSRPFTAGEVVTVRTSLHIAGHRTGTWSFRVATPAKPLAAVPLIPAKRLKGDVAGYRSRPELKAPTLNVVSANSDGDTDDIFLGNQNGPYNDGPLIYDAQGHLVWFKPLPANVEANDVKVQRYGGRPVLTWWQGRFGPGIGVGGEDVIDDSSYRQIAVVRAGNGLSADLHEFTLTPQGTALITAYYPVVWDESSLHGPRRGNVLDGVVQEVDVKTGNVLFQWDSLDHVPITEAEIGLPKPGAPFDYFHVNSVKSDLDGNLLVSGRNTWAAYKVDRATGAIAWRLGGRKSTFRLGAGAQFAFQHDVEAAAANDAAVTIFDDGAGPPAVHKTSRALTLALDHTARTATVTHDVRHAPGLLAAFEGNVQALANGDSVVGWGQQPYVTQFNSAGKVVFDARFGDANSSYRAFRFPWTGTPHTAVAVAPVRTGSHLTVYVSWNGATSVTGWRVLGGASRATLKTLLTTPRTGFETAIPTSAVRYVKVEALDHGGRVIGGSGLTKAR
jgi:hypothetical protein